MSRDSLTALGLPCAPADAPIGQVLAWEPAPLLGFWWSIGRGLPWLTPGHSGEMRQSLSRMHESLSTESHVTTTGCHLAVTPQRVHGDQAAGRSGTDNLSGPWVYPKTRTSITLTNTGCLRFG